MRIAPAVPARGFRPSGRRVALTVDSDLGATILRMIATNSLSAFTPSVGRPSEAQPVRGVPPAAPLQSRDAGGAPQRPLGAVPSQPSQPLPRGSLLDLRV
ncbi:hypothetical protein E2C06_26925 [Dankookia rubra]|uniref:Uncharacterized protein n=1 Tax=Dankookia rubra TaxID=1442381 RepID=A0A4R5QA26_9PROT|nr:hypothetical protein [Dankookia rubra]TDH59513.1 hypothetical protein E2C06_26925 [Dankookia rubra]